MDDEWRKWRCPSCGRILAEVGGGQNTLRIKCQSCNSFNTLRESVQERGTATAGSRR